MSPPYKITFIPSEGTDLTETDITNTLTNYNGYKEARYFFLQVETVEPGDNTGRIGIAEIEIYDPLGNNIALNTITSPTDWLSLGNLVNGDYASTDIAEQRGVAGERTWVGIDLAGILDLGSGIPDRRKYLIIMTHLQGPFFQSKLINDRLPWDPGQP